jgi:hypothetical protein
MASYEFNEEDFKLPLHLALVEDSQDESARKTLRKERI